MQKYIDDFLQHLKYERNASEHTLRNYESDLAQFYDHIAPPDENGDRRKVDLPAIDNLTVREYMASLYEKKKKKSSIHRKIAALRTFFRFLCREGILEVNPAKLVASPRVEQTLPNHLNIEQMVRFIETPETDTVLGNATGRYSNCFMPAACASLSWSISTSTISTSAIWRCASRAKGVRNAWCLSAITPGERSRNIWACAESCSLRPIRKMPIHLRYS
jgi:integrase